MCSTAALSLSTGVEPSAEITGKPAHQSTPYSESGLVPTPDGHYPAPTRPPRRPHLATSEKAGECAKVRTPLRCTPTVAASTPRSRSSRRSVESREELTRPAPAGYRGAGRRGAGDDQATKLRAQAVRLREQPSQRCAAAQRPPQGRRWQVPLGTGACTPLFSGKAAAQQRGCHQT